MEREGRAMIEHCTDALAETDAVVSWAQTLMNDHGLASHEICIAPYKPDIRTALEAAGIQTLQLKPRMADPGESEPGIRLGTIHRIKGLEFRAVALACADASDPMNDITHAEPLDRCTRYVAATRAREHLLITVVNDSAGSGAFAERAANEKGEAI